MTKSNKKENIELSAEEQTKAEKKRLRLEAIKERELLGIDESLKTPGMRYRLCNVTPGNIERYRSMGYEVVSKPIADQSSDVAKAVTAAGCADVDVGKTSVLKAVWMETSEENYQILREIEADKAKAQDAMLYESEIPEENRIGTITKDYSK